MSEGVQCNGADVPKLEYARKNSYHPQLLQMPPTQCIDLSFENISYSVPLSVLSREKKTVLNGVSGLFKAGELTAIMGPSGAGKSSLLNVLSGFIKEGATGCISVNNIIQEDCSSCQIKQHSAYILQDDFLQPVFTVMEIMFHAANVKLGRTTVYKSKVLLIENILESMSLTEAKNTRCNRLSGGEKKRLNVCLELIDNPPVLFLDEPTSGLDSSSCGLLVSELKGLAEAGRTVICTIHQPSAAIFSLFDHLYLLSSGKNIYQGDTANLLKFLEHISLPCPIFHNPTDFVMDIASGEFGSYTDKFETAMEINWRSKKEIVLAKGSKVRSEKNKFSNDMLIEQHKRPSEFERFTYLVPQMLKQLHRDWSVTYTKVVMHAVIGVLMGLLFHDSGDNGAKVFSNFGYWFTSLAYFSFTSLMPAALKFPAEINILKKEHFNNWYKFKTYYLAFLFVHIPVQMLLTFIFVIISYYLTGQLLEVERFLLAVGVCMNASVQSLILGLFMGTFGGANGVFNGSVFIVIMAVHGGFIAFIKDFPYPLYLFSFLSFFRYSFELIMIALYGLDRDKLPCPEPAFYCHFRYPETLFKDTGFSEANLLRNIALLFILTTFVGIFTFFRLRKTLKTFYKV